MSTEPEHKFELALPLGLLDKAKEFAEELENLEGPSSTSTARWTRLGNAATLVSDADLAKYCFKKAHDYGSLILFATTTGIIYSIY